MNIFDLDERGAILSECQRYRYCLTRRWDAGNPVLFIGLNPSTADALKDDPTVRRCVGFARAWWYPAMGIVNLFAWRATDPAELRKAADPVGPENDQYIKEAASCAGKIVAASGAYGSGLRLRTVASLINRELFCLGCTRDGFPRHPLYLPKTAELVSYWRPKQ
jgi:hypothetical protein